MVIVGIQTHDFAATRWVPYCFVITADTVHRITSVVTIVQLMIRGYFQTIFEGRGAVGGPFANTEKAPINQLYFNCYAPQTASKLEAATFWATPVKCKLTFPLLWGTPREESLTPPKTAARAELYPDTASGDVLRFSMFSKHLQRFN